MPRQAKSVRAGTISATGPLGAKKSKRELRREAIIAAAKELFFTQGFERTSMDEIVVRVGGSKATLYSHFPSKDELLLSLVAHMTQPAIAEALSVDPTQDFPDFLRALGRVTMRWLCSPDIIGMQRLAASEALRFPEFGRTYYEQGILPGLQQGALLFKSAMETGALRQGDPLLAANFLIEMCAGWAWRRQIWNIAPAPTSEEIGSRVDAAVETFLHGYNYDAARDQKWNRSTSGAADAKNSGARSATPVAPEKSRRDVKLEAMITTAKELFFARGYAAVSMSDVVARVGGSKSTLYRHFPSKAALLVAVVQNIEGGHTLEISNAPSEAHSKSGAIAQNTFRKWLTDFGLIAAARLTSLEFVSLQRIAAAEAAVLPEVGKAFYEAGVVPAFAQFVGQFSTAMDCGVIRRGSPELAAEHFIEMCTGWPMRLAIWGVAPPPTEAEIADQVSAAVETFLQGYARAAN